MCGLGNGSEQKLRALQNWFTAMTKQRPSLAICCIEAIQAGESEALGAMYILVAKIMSSQISKVDTFRRRRDLRTRRLLMYERIKLLNAFLIQREPGGWHVILPATNISVEPVCLLGNHFPYTRSVLLLFQYQSPQQLAHHLSHDPRRDAQRPLVSTAGISAQLHQ